MKKICEKIWNFIVDHFLKHFHSLAKKPTKIGLVAVIIAIIGFVLIKELEFNLLSIFALIALCILCKQLIINLGRQHELKFILSFARLKQKLKLLK